MLILVNLGQILIFKFQIQVFKFLNFIFYDENRFNNLNTAFYFVENGYKL